MTEREPQEPDLSAFPTVQHRIEGGVFVCPGDEGSRCHRYPSCGCELWPCGHEYIAQEDCWVAPWINGSVLEDSYNEGVGDFVPADVDGWPDGDADWEWEDDYVLWNYTPSPEAARQS